MELFTSLYIPDGTPAQVQSLIEMQLASATPGGAAKLRDLIDGFDVTACLPRVRAPTLLIHGRGDRVQPPEQSRLIASAVPDAAMVLTDTSNYVPLPQEAAWEVLLGETERFLLGEI